MLDYYAPTAKQNIALVVVNHTTDTKCWDCPPKLAANDPFYNSKIPAKIINGVISANSVSKERLFVYLDMMFDLMPYYEKQKLVIAGPRQFYNEKKKLSTLKYKTLVILDSDILVKAGDKGPKAGLRDPQKFAKYYIRKFKIVTESELADLIKEGSDQYFLMSPSNEISYVYYSLYDLAKKKVIYTEYDKPVFGGTSIIEKSLSNLNEELSK